MSLFYERSQIRIPLNDKQPHPNRVKIYFKTNECIMGNLVLLKVKADCVFRATLSVLRLSPQVSAVGTPPTVRVAGPRALPVWERVRGALPGVRGHCLLSPPGASESVLLPLGYVGVWAAVESGWAVPPALPRPPIHAAVAPSGPDEAPTPACLSSSWLSIRTTGLG